MKFLVDENIGTSIVGYLRKENHDTVWVKEKLPGMDDEDILKLALKDRRVIITRDLDFGELVFMRGKAHVGVILIRLNTDDTSYQLKALKNFLAAHTPKGLSGHFWKVGDEWL